jgi:hypothetical protein
MHHSGRLVLIKSTLTLTFQVEILFVTETLFFYLPLHALTAVIGSSSKSEIAIVIVACQFTCRASVPREISELNQEEGSALFYLTCICHGNNSCFLLTRTC